ncbi:MAG: STAS domain-containing protein [Glaciimonas sp.]|nr:STAS domain-containing protein [Glaciimonas sp.]
MFQPGHLLTFGNATTVLEQGLQALAQQQSVIDMAAVTTVDSSAVAVLLAWQRAASASKLLLTLDNLPSNLHSLIALYGVEDLLLSTAAGGHPVLR